MKAETLLADASFLYAALNSAQTNIFIADREFKLTYMNPKAEQTLKNIKNGILEVFGVRVEDLIGKSIDIFHKNPAHQRKILSDPKNLPHQAYIQLGPETLDLLVSPIYDKDKNYIGAMVTWEVITKKLEMETKASQMNSMMENAPINIMLVIKKLEDELIKLKQLVDKFIETKKQLNVSDNLIHEANQIALSNGNNVLNQSGEK